MLRFVSMLAALFVAGIGSPAPTQARLAYTFTLARDSAGAPVVEVSATFSGDTGTIAHVVHPTTWAGERQLERAITRVEFLPPAHLLDDSDGAYVVEHPRNSPISIRYALKQDWTGKLRYPQYHRAIVGDEYVVFNAQNGLLFPDRQSERSVPIDVTWKNVPADWVVTTSFGGGLVQRGTATAPELVDASFAAGKFRQSGSAGLSIAIGGTWRFADSTFDGIIQRVYDTERRFWGDTKPRSYFVVLLPMDRRGGVGGTAFTGGFVSVADTLSRAEAVGLNVAHELFHEWNGHELRTKATPEGPDKWFSEGFTDYYADRMSHDVHILDDSEYVDRVNRAIRRYYTSPVRGATRSTIAEEYWLNPNAKDYPYTQGYLFAMYANRLIANATHGSSTLDDVMRSIHRTARDRNVMFSDAMFVGAAPVAIRSRLRAGIDSMITRGATIPVLPKSIPGCDSVEIRRVELFDLGFDGNATTSDGVVHGLRANGPAARAGLKEGTRLRAWNWYAGESERPVRLILRDTTVITYLPTTGEVVMVPTIVGCVRR